MTEFVEDWSILHTLGEGAFGEVKLLVHRITGDTVAVKIIDLEIHKDAEPVVKKEVAIHKLLGHPNVIRFFGTRKENLKEYIFLEYASGGELFNKIEPDIGMPSWEACSYFLQLLSGLQYLHTQGITHRDIKPENLLLGSSATPSGPPGLLGPAGVLKISDFGLATVFRLRGRERRLQQRCGTPPYLAPEVLEGEYRGEPIDIWASGVVLTAMLSGELPWDAPSEDQPEFQDWVDGKYMLLSPWKKLDTMALSLIRRILDPNPESRLSIERILRHRWMTTPHQKSEDTIDSISNIHPGKRLCSHDTLPNTQKEVAVIGLSQPVTKTVSPSSTEEMANILQQRDVICFSQPVHFDDLILSSQIQFTQSPINKDNFDKLVYRMTRFFVTTNCDKTLKILCGVLEKMKYTWSTDNSGLITISTVDCRKMPLIFKANFINMDGKLLLDFRLSKGCGIEFKKRFVQIKNSLQNIIYNDKKA